VEKVEIEEQVVSSTGDDRFGDVMVVGGGISGIQAALDLAESGFKVYLIDKSPAIAIILVHIIYDVLNKLCYALSLKNKKTRRVSPTFIKPHVCMDGVASLLRTSTVPLCGIPSKRAEACPT